MTQLRTILIIAIACLCFNPLMGRKQSTMSRGLKPATTVAATPENGAWTDTVEDVRLKALGLSGYDKPINATRETFFVSNRTDSTIVSLTITLTYTDMSGRLLHKATHTVSCDIPAGETRSAWVPAWDRQHSFYYHKSTVPRRSSTPYDVTYIIDRATIKGSRAQTN